MRPGRVLAAGLALLTLALAIVLTRAEPRPAGSNYVAEWGPAVELRGVDRHCQEAGLVPGDTAALRLLVGTHHEPAPAIRAVVRRPGGELLTSGSIPAGAPQGHVLVPLRPVQHTTEASSACISTGPGRRTVLYGSGTDTVRLEWMREGRESWLALAPAVAHRFGLARPNPLGDWLIVLAAALLLGAWAVALRLLLREAGG